MGINVGIAKDGQAEMTVWCCFLFDEWWHDHERAHHELPRVHIGHEQLQPRWWCTIIIIIIVIVVNLVDGHEDRLAHRSIYVDLWARVPACLTIIMIIMVIIITIMVMVMVIVMRRFVLVLFILMMMV